MVSVRLVGTVERPVYSCTSIPLRGCHNCGYRGRTHHCHRSCRSLNEQLRPHSSGLPRCLTVVEGVAGATSGEPDTEEGAECVVAPLALQAVVFPSLTLVDVLTLPSLLLETHWTRIVLSEILSVVTRVVSLSVDTYRALRAVDIKYKI